MRQTLHIFKKDVRFLWREIAIIVFIAAFFAVLHIPALHSGNSVSSAELALLSLAPLMIARLILAEAIPDFVEEARAHYGIASPIALGCSNGANFAAAKPDVERTRRELEREQTLEKVQVSTKQRLEVATADYERNAAIMVSRQAELGAQSKQLGVLDTQEAQLKADLAAKRASLKVARRYAVPSWIRGSATLSTPLVPAATSATSRAAAAEVTMSAG